MNTYEQWVRDGQYVEAGYASGNGVHGRGKVYSYTDQPTVGIERADGTRFDWIASLCQEGDPRAELPQPIKLRQTEQADDPVNHPHHYTDRPSGVECITVTEHMGFCLGNAVKYIWRADLKNDAIEDLEKARWYLDREIARRKADHSAAA